METCPALGLAGWPAVPWGQEAYLVGKNGLGVGRAVCVGRRWRLLVSPPGEPWE